MRCLCTRVRRRWFVVLIALLLIVIALVVVAVVAVLAHKYKQQRENLQAHPRVFSTAFSLAPQGV